MDWLRSLVVAIPGIGGSLDLLIAGRGQRLAQERIVNLLSGLKEEMSEVRSDMLDRVFLETDEWADLVIKAVDAATKSRDKAKIRLYARILRSAATFQDRGAFSPEEYLDALAELTPREVVVARAIYGRQQDVPSSEQDLFKWAKDRGWDRLPQDCPSVPEEDLPFILIRLERSGLIKEITGMYWDYQGGMYIITNAFRQLVQYIGSMESLEPTWGD